MKIRLLHDYKGLPSNYEKLLKGEHDLAPELAQYLVDNGHALLLDIFSSEPAKPVADVTQAEAPEDSPKVSSNRKRK